MKNRHDQARETQKKFTYDNRSSRSPIQGPPAANASGESRQRKPPISALLGNRTASSHNRSNWLDRNRGSAWARAGARPGAYIGPRPHRPGYGRARGGAWWARSGRQGGRRSGPRPRRVSRRRGRARWGLGFRAAFRRSASASAWRRVGRVAGVEAPGRGRRAVREEGRVVLHQRSFVSVQFFPRSSRHRVGGCSLSKPGQMGWPGTARPGLDYTSQARHANYTACRAGMRAVLPGPGTTLLLNGPAHV